MEEKTFSIVLTPTAREASPVIKCIDTPTENWMRLKKGELSLPRGRSQVSDLWEFNHVSIVDEAQKVLFSTDESLGLSEVPEAFLKDLVEKSKKATVLTTIKESEFSAFCLQNQH